MQSQPERIQRAIQHHRQFSLSTFPFPQVSHLIVLACVGFLNADYFRLPTRLFLQPAQARLTRSSPDPEVYRCTRQSFTIGETQCYIELHLNSNKNGLLQ